jgi:hypothetical protein
VHVISCSGVKAREASPPEPRLHTFLECRQQTLGPAGHVCKENKAIEAHNTDRLVSARVQSGAVLSGMSARSFPGQSFAKPSTIPEGMPSADASPDTFSAWRQFKAEQERCRARFATLSELPQWSAGPWLQTCNEVLQVGDRPTL